MEHEGRAKGDHGRRLRLDYASQPVPQISGRKKFFLMFCAGAGGGFGGAILGLYAWVLVYNCLGAREDIGWRILPLAPVLMLIGCAAGIVIPVWWMRKEKRKGKGKGNGDCAK